MSIEAGDGCRTIQDYYAMLAADSQRLRVVRHELEVALRVIAEDHPNGYLAAKVARDALARSVSLPEPPKGRNE